MLLKEFIRLRAVKHDDGSEDAGTIEITKDFNSTLKLKSREYHSNLQGGFRLQLDLNLNQVRRFLEWDNINNLILI